MTTQTATAPKEAASIHKRQIFLVDDHSIFRRGLASLIETEPDLALCGEADSARNALEGLRQVRADAAVLDVSLPGANGIELLKQVRAEHPRLPILVLSAHDESQYALRALRAGAGGYIMKREAAEVFVTALRKVVDGKIAVSSNFGEELIYKVAQGAGTNGSSPLDVLTDRELEVLQLVGEGRSSKDIAEKLHLSVKTVESHRLHVKEKLNLPSAQVLVRFAVDWVEQQGKWSPQTEAAA